MLNRLEVDQAVFYALAARVWQLVAGPVTLVLIAWYFTPETQGYYYTFWSIIALQTFFELSFPQVIINFASHEWERLRLNDDGAVEGNTDSLSRLSSLLRISLVWYGCAAVLFFVVAIYVGLAFFSSYGASSGVVVWRAPWCVLVTLTAVTFATIPCLAILEGCNQVKNVYKLQFAQAVAGNLFVWPAIYFGAGLWALPIAALVRLTAEVALVAGGYRRFFYILAGRHDGPSIHWRNEVWPMQWRLAIKAIVVYFNTYFITPVIFAYHGEVASGQVGMTWQILTTLSNACNAWVRTRAARFGMLVAKGDYQELDRIFFRLTTISVIVLAIGSATFSLFDVVLYETGSRFASRLLSPGPTIMLAIGTTLSLISSCQWIYIHAHKKSPYLLLTVLGSIMTGTLIFTLGRPYGAVGVAVAYTGVTVLYFLPVWSWAWHRCRTEWHGEGHDTSAEDVSVDKQEG
jgi:O-antigen/teichoic acid export membrane protein